MSQKDKKDENTHTQRFTVQIGEAVDRGIW